MALNYFRRSKVLTSKFPCKAHVKRLSRVKDVKSIGVFTVDKCRIVVDVPWRDSDLPGKDLGKKKLFKKGRPIGFLSRRKYLGHCYQIFQGFGKNRVVLINPRHFKSFNEFHGFTLRLLDGRPYRITGIDLSWMLSKKFFSIDFLFWSLWIKNGTIFKPTQIEQQLDKDLNKCKYKEFRIGKRTVFKAYDTDIHNTNKKRPEEWQMNDSINFEIALDRDTMKKLGIFTLKDLRNFHFIEKAIKRFQFIEPSRISFKNTDFEFMHEYWERHGASKTPRKIFRLLKTKNYTHVESFLKPLQIGEKDMKIALLELAQQDWQKFKKGGLERYRYPLRHVIYDTPTLFK